MKTEELEDYWKSQDCIKPRKRELKEVYKTNNINKRNKRTKPIKNILSFCYDITNSIERNILFMYT